MCKFKVGTLNLNGARDRVKRASLFHLIDIKKLDVVLVQETHSTPDLECEWMREWTGQVHLSHNTSCSAGVGLLFSRSFLPISTEVEEVIAGRLLKVRAQFENTYVVFICVYMPVSENLETLKNIGLAC